MPQSGNSFPRTKESRNGASVPERVSIPAFTMIRMLGASALAGVRNPMWSPLQQMHMCALLSLAPQSLVLLPLRPHTLNFDLVLIT